MPSDTQATQNGTNAKPDNVLEKSLRASNSATNIVINYELTNCFKLFLYFCKMENISEHITYDEATISPTGLRLKIDNTPTAKQLEAMKFVAVNLFEPIRAKYGKPIHINSFFRCDALNKAVKGSSTSQHVKGEAIDISGGSKAENKILFEIAKTLNFDQLLNEFDFSWIHISLKKSGNRKQILAIT